MNSVWGEGRAAPTLIVAPVITGNTYDGSTLTSNDGHMGWVSSSDLFVSMDCRWYQCWFKSEYLRHPSRGCWSIDSLYGDGNE